MNRRADQTPAPRDALIGWLRGVKAWWHDFADRPLPEDIPEIARFIGELRDRLDKLNDAVVYGKGFHFFVRQRVTFSDVMKIFPGTDSVAQAFSTVVDDLGALIRQFNENAPKTPAGDWSQIRYWLREQINFITRRVDRALEKAATTRIEFPKPPERLIEHEFHIGRVKVTVEDKHEAAEHGAELVVAVREAEALLRKKGFGFLWYGDVRLLAQQANTSAGAQYFPGRDEVVLYRLRSFSRGKDYVTLERTLIHELAHRLWTKFLTERQRQEFEGTFKTVPSTTDYGGELAEEDFAEVFMTYVTGHGRAMTGPMVERFRRAVEPHRLRSAASWWERTMDRVRDWVHGEPRRASASDDTIEVIDNAGYKDISGIRRIPIASAVDPRTKERTLLVGNEAIDAAGARIPGKEYMSDAEMRALFSDEVVAEEKCDGHPVIVLYGGYTFFCESLRYQHTVEYDQVPFSVGGWPDYTVCYDILEGEHRPPFSRRQHGWLTRDQKEALCDMVGAPLVPLVFQGRLQPEDVPALANRLSSFARGAKAEGVVLKNLRKGVFGKFVNVEFQQHVTDEALRGDAQHPMLLKKKNVRRFGSRQTMLARHVVVEVRHRQRFGTP